MMKILIVDDNADNRRLLRLNLEHQGSVTVVEACDGQEGLELARQHHPNLIISDALMPRLDGYQFLRLLKGEEALRDIPFVFYSAIYTDTKDEELALSLGAAAYIAKPMEPEAFQAELSAILRSLEVEKEHPGTPIQLEEEKEYLRKYSDVVAEKLKIKVKELEEALARRRKAEEALRSQFIQFSTIFDAINALVFTADLETGEMLYMNHYGGSLFGHDWTGKTFSEVFQSEPGSYWGQCPSDILVENGIPQQPCVHEFHNPTNDRWYQGIDRAINWPNGRLARLHIAFDITERKELEHIKDEMISAVTHEMCTPLTALLGYTEFMLGNDLTLPQMREHLQVVQQEANRLNEMIENFLDIQQQRARSKSANYCPADLRLLLEEAAATFALPTKLHPFRLDCPDKLPPILGDKLLLRRMFQILLSNAIRYSPSGGEIQVHLCVLPEENNLRIQVTDHGIGIPEKKLDHVFELFYRVDSDNHHIFGGIGLGLAVVKEIVLGMGGEIWVKSCIGQGSTFYINLPIYLEGPQKRSSGQPLQNGNEEKGSDRG
jgi:two-component system, OmpR family, phosphate regulon sensor histidine kinase PhoR